MAAAGVASILSGLLGALGLMVSLPGAAEPRAAEPGAELLRAAGPLATIPEARRSGTEFLPPALLARQRDPSSNPVTLWVERGKALWNGTAGDASAASRSCAGCHGGLSSEHATVRAVPTFPRLQAGRLINLEDQIERCMERSADREGETSAERRDPQRLLREGESETILALSAALNHAAAGLPMAPRALAEPQGQARLAQGAQAYVQRMGRLNLACVHCHDQHVGRNLRTEVISPGHPTGFPVYRQRWQTLGSLERRLRACFSGVQAEMPPPGDPLLRDLELFLKARAQGMPLEGPSLRR